MEGWGISLADHRRASSAPPAPIPREPAIDIDAVADRMEGDEHDPSNDPFYVVNLTTGIPVLVDVGSGYYPVVLRDPFRYGPNDPKASESNLIFETVEEGAGLPQGAYRPDSIATSTASSITRTHGRGGGARRRPIRRRRRHHHLVRARDRHADPPADRPARREDGVRRRPHRSPEGPERAAGPLALRGRPPSPRSAAGSSGSRTVLTDKRLASYYGDIAGTGLDHVAFTWTFTTQPTHEDMRLLRDGLYGKGPFARWKNEYPPELDRLARRRQRARERGAARRLGGIEPRVRPAREDPVRPQARTTRTSAARSA